MSEPDVQKVSIYNSELGRHFELYVRRDRLSEFCKLVLAGRQPDAPQGMPGLSWAAVTGLDAIFAKRPKKFPVYDIQAWLQQVLTGQEPPVSKPEIEKALERFSAAYPPDISESA